MWKILCLMAAAVVITTAGVDSSAAPLQVGDSVSIQVPGWQEFGGTNLKIDENGAIHLVTIGRVEASGKTIAELANEIEQRLSHEVLNPQVSVTVRR